MVQSTVPVERELEVHAKQALNKLTRTLLLNFSIPLLIIVGLVFQQLRLSWRIAALEEHAIRLDVLQDMSLTERIFTQTRNYEWAINRYVMLLDRYSHAQILTRLAGLYVEIGEPERAIALLENGKSLQHDRWVIYSTLLFVRLKQGREKEALEAAEMALELNASDAQTYNNAAWVYATAKHQTLRNLARAEAYAKKAVELTRGRKANYLDTLAEIYFRRGKADLAVATIDQAIALDEPGSGALQRQKRRFEEAASS